MRCLGSSNFDIASVIFLTDHGRKDTSSVKERMIGVEVRAAHALIMREYFENER